MHVHISLKVEAWKLNFFSVLTRITVKNHSFGFGPNSNWPVYYYEISWVNRNLMTTGRCNICPGHLIPFLFNVLYLIATVHSASTVLLSLPRYIQVQCILYFVSTKKLDSRNYDHAKLLWFRSTVCTHSTPANVIVI